MFTRGSFTILMSMGPPGLGWTHEGAEHECFGTSANHTSCGDKSVSLCVCVCVCAVLSKSPKPKTCHHALRDLEVLSLKAMKVKHKH